jgi:uncharacterized protein with HEPN domain
MERKATKELLHIKGWLDRVDEIVERGKDAYLADDLLQEAGDSLMMKLGEAAKRLSRLDVLALDGVDWALAVANRNFLIHQYDEINQPRVDLADALARSARMEAIVGDDVRRGERDHQPRVRQGLNEPELARSRDSIALHQPSFPEVPSRG